MPLLYLDTCAIQRPLDDRTQFRVRIEAEAVEAILHSIRRQEHRLATSAALRIETGRVSDPKRLIAAQAVLKLADVEAPFSSKTRELASTFEQQGLRSFDAVHLAFATAAHADFFCTTDDKLLRRAVRLNTDSVQAVAPLELANLLSL